MQHQTDAWRHDDGTTIPSLLEARLVADPDKPFLTLLGQDYSAAELDDLARRFSAALIEFGVAAGDRVATLLENGIEFVVAWLGTVRIGAIAVPINSAYKGPLLHHQLVDAGVSVLVVSNELIDRLELLDPLPDLRHVVVTEPSSREAEARWHSWSDVMAADADRGSHDITASDPATIIYTGGTTGPSKGCLLSHHYHAVLAREVNTSWRRAPEDVVWTPLPLFHFNALAIAVVGTLLVGGRAAVARRFSVSNFWPQIEASQASIASLMGSMAVLLASAPDHPLQRGSEPSAGNRSLRLMCAVPMAASVSDQLQNRFHLETFSAGYGTTEAALLSWLPPGVENRPDAAGVVNDEYFDVRIFDESDSETPCGDVGEIVCRPRRPFAMFDGYWNRPQATLDCMRNLWFHTGDLGRVDADGYLYFVDRKADYLRRRGENVSSWELERVFLAHDDVIDVAVHAVPSELGEDEIKVTAVARPHAQIDPGDLFDWAVARLPYFALPRYIEFRTELPRSPLGRVLKYELRQDGVTDITWDRDEAGVNYERR